MDNYRTGDQEIGVQMWLDNITLSKELNKVVLTVIHSGDMSAKE